MGQIWEQLIGKLTALVGGGKWGQSGLPFTPMENLRTACDRLRAEGYPAMGREVMYSGITGEPLDGLVYIGCVYYQRLRPRVSCGEVCAR